MSKSRSRNERPAIEYTPAMKPHPRIRKTIKWGGLAVSLLLIIAWFGSGWYFARWIGRSGYGAAMTQGLMVVGFEAPLRGAAILPEWDVDKVPFSIHWWFVVERRPPSWAIGCPLWIPTAAALLITNIAWRLDLRARRRAKAGRCPKCEYDRTGLAAGAVCPECGAAQPS